MTATYGAMKAVPEESVTCISNGVQVYADAQPGIAGATSWTANWTMWSQGWENMGGGAANCVANVYYFTYSGKVETGYVMLASATFAVG